MSTDDEISITTTDLINAGHSDTWLTQAEANMIKLPNDTELNELKNFNQPFATSLYLPYSPGDRRRDPNRIALKNLLTEAESALLMAGATPKQVKKTLRPALKLLEQYEGWPMRHNGLAVFMQQDFFRYYQLPEPSQYRLLSVMSSFDLDPLLQIIDNNQPYLVLALGHKNIKLYGGDQYEIHQIALKDLPDDMHRALNIDEFPKNRETHNIAPAKMGKGSEAFHGQYNVAEVDKKMLLKFFRLIDKRLHKILNKNRLPLIIAGTDYLLPIYRKVNTYDNLVPGGIIGDIKKSDIDQVRQKAWMIITQNKIQ